MVVSAPAEGVVGNACKTTASRSSFEVQVLPRKLSNLSFLFFFLSFFMPFDDVVRAAVQAGLHVGGNSSARASKLSSDWHMELASRVAVCGADLLVTAKED